MSKSTPPLPPAPLLGEGVGHNQPVYTVSEVSFSIKRTVEDRFGVVRVRGEISGLKVASSGHVYFRLKDENAVIDAVCWRGTMGKMSFRPEEGLEVICSGKITTFPGKSSYQIVVDSMEPAGAGALMALLEKRRKMLEAEGLFDVKRKKPLPFLPKIIGVITSPTGAVIRDILHRIEDRFPVRVIVWPVMVQGEGAADQITAAIKGFNNLLPPVFPAENAMSTGSGLSRPAGLAPSIPIPDVLIIARGGGSIEDLWAFNEENVLRAAAASRIPIISAVGHETDTTLLDFVADMRAPTPTAAAEMAVPVRQELWVGCKQLDARLHAAVMRLIEQRQDRLAGLVRGLPKPMQLLQLASQRLDDWSERLKASLPAMLSRKEQELSIAAARLRPQTQLLQAAAQHLNNWGERLKACLPAMLARKEQELSLAVSRLRPQSLQNEMLNLNRRLGELQQRLNNAWERYMARQLERLEAWGSRLENANYHKVLERGFTLVKDRAGKLVTSVRQAQEAGTLSLTFKDGDITVKLTGQ